MAAIPATYQMVARSGPDREKSALSAAWLVALHPLMPRLSTRALVSVVALPPLTVGIALASGRRFVDGMLAACALGCACLFRFQLGLVYLGVITVLAFLRRKSCLMGFILGSSVFLVLLSTISPDVLETLYRYFVFNAEHSSSFGTSPWYTYIVFFGLLTCPPLTFWLAKPLWYAARDAPIVSAPLFVFFAVHSLIPHKEERFMFAALPLSFALLALALCRIPRWATRTFWTINLVLVIPITLSDGNRAVAEPLAAVGRQDGINEVVVYGRFYAPSIYVERKAKITQVKPGDALPCAPALTRYIFAEGGPEPDLSQLRCSERTTYRGDFIDRVLVTLNPHGNKRRRPRIATDCDGPLHSVPTDRTP